MSWCEHTSDRRAASVLDGVWLGCYATSMHSPIAYCGLTLALVRAGVSAPAAELVTTSETDGSITSVVIVDPLDGAVIPPVYPVVMEYQTFGGGQEIHLAVDGVDVGNCNGQEDFTCTLEVTLTPGEHT